LRGGSIFACLSKNKVKKERWRGGKKRTGKAHAFKYLGRNGWKWDKPDRRESKRRLPGNPRAGYGVEKLRTVGSRGKGMPTLSPLKGSLLEESLSDRETFDSKGGRRNRWAQRSHRGGKGIDERKDGQALSTTTNRKNRERDSGNVTVPWKSNWLVDW